MDYKKSKAARTTITRDIPVIQKRIGNVYETIAVLAKRSNQISAEIREELIQKLNEFATNNDSLEEIFENREQIEISKFYERLPKPVLIAIDEWLEDRIYYRKTEEQSNDL